MLAQPAIWLPAGKMQKSNHLNKTPSLFKNTLIDSIIPKKSSILFSFFPSLVSKPLFKISRLSCIGHTGIVV